MKKSKILKIFIAILLLISLEVTAIAATIGVVNADTVRVREKPSTEAGSDIVGLVSIGKKVTIMGEEGNWYKIKGTDDHGKKIEGYIRKDLLTVDGKITEVTENKNNNKDTNSSDKSVDNKTDKKEEPVVNPEVSQEPEVGIENSGEAIDTTNDTTTTGDVSTSKQPTENAGEIVQEKDTTISTIKVSKVGTVGQKVQLAQETKIKILPSANSSNIASLSENTEVTIVEIINSWCRIEAGEYVGWVRIDQ